MKKLLLAFVLFSNFSHAKLIDKIAGAINDNIYTLSEINRVQATLPIRKEIAPFIYKKSKYTNIELLKILQNQFIIRDKLAEIGYVIGDDRVEQNIQQTEQRLRLTRSQLLSFLESNKITFNEYFELMRSAMEYSTFLQRIISPLVIITDQEVKNAYYNTTQNKKTLSFKYELVNFVINRKGLSQKDIDKLPQTLERYRKTGSIPEKFKDLVTNDMGSIVGDDLPVALNELLRVTNEKEFSRPYLADDLVHLFYLKKKDLVASEDFKKSKDRIYQQLFEKKSAQLVTDWLQREALNYYILEDL